MLYCQKIFHSDRRIAVFTMGTGDGCRGQVVPVQEARKATKCLLCCWSAAQSHSYANAVICRRTWRILTRSDGEAKLQLFTVDRGAHVGLLEKCAPRLPETRVLFWPQHRLVFINCAAVAPHRSLLVCTARWHLCATTWQLSQVNKQQGDYLHAESAVRLRECVRS